MHVCMSCLWLNLSGWQSFKELRNVKYERVNQNFWRIISLTALSKFVSSFVWRFPWSMLTVKTALGTRWTQFSYQIWWPSLVSDYFFQKNQKVLKTLSIHFICIYGIFESCFTMHQCKKVVLNSSSTRLVKKTGNSLKLLLVEILKKYWKLYLMQGHPYKESVSLKLSTWYYCIELKPLQK